MLERNLTSTWFNNPLPVHRCVYVCDWLPPDFGAVGQYSIQFCRERAREGQDVLLLGFSSQSASVKVEYFDTGGRLTITRLKVGSYDRKRLWPRLWWTLKINLRLLFALLGAFRGTDELVFTGSPPFILHWVAPLNLVLRKKVVYRITDFYPECLIAARGKPGLLLTLLYRLTLFWRRRIPILEVLGEDQRGRLIESGIKPERIRIRRDPSPVTVEADTPPLEVPVEFAGMVVLLYSGNFGVAHDYETFIAGYLRHHRNGTGSVALWLNAVGSGADIVENRLRLESVPVVRGRPVPLEQLSSLLVAPHAHLITLKDEFMGYVMPSKVYGCIESGKDVLYIGTPRSDVHFLCLEGMPQEAYFQANVGEPETVFAALEQIAARAHKSSRTVRTPLQVEQVSGARCQVAEKQATAPSSLTPDT